VNVQKINLEEIRQGFRGRPFCKLVEHHLYRQKQDDRIRGIHGTVEMLPEEAKPLVESFIDRWNGRAYEKELWKRDTKSVFDEIIDDARRVLHESGITSDDEILFNMFNIIVLSYAYNAYDQPKMREFIGVNSGRFPWISALSLLYPVSAAFYISTRTPASITMVIGYGLANLGYVMFVAGIFGGTYRVFGITKRWQVFVGAIMAFLFGTILSNISV